MPDLKIRIVYSQSHTVFPRIIFGVLIIFALIIIIQSIMKSMREKKAIISFDNRRFFIEQFDKTKLFGSLALLVAYSLALKFIGFLLSGIIFISLFNILFSGDRSKKGIIKSIIISTIETLIIWFVFGYLFNITLP